METNSDVKSKKKGSRKRPKFLKMKSGEIKIVRNLSRAQRRINKEQKNPGAMIYISHIPHGFYEDEMTSYFSQFGKVLAVIVVRSKKSGRSRGFGFVKFADEEVAKIAADSMNNYLMYNRILKCEYIPPKKSVGRSLKSKITPWDYPRKKNRRVDAANKKNSISKLTKEAYKNKAQKKISAFKELIEKKSQTRKKASAK